jgi:mannose-6-phosphate isomerase-like protein (cupin superfamily)
MKITSLASLPEGQVSHNPEIKKKVMLGPGDLPHVTNFSQARFAPGQVASAHAHRDMYEVFFVESGTGLMRVDGVEHRLEPGICVAVDPGEIHEIVNAGLVDLVLTYFGVQDQT